MGWVQRAGVFLMCVGAGAVWGGCGGVCGRVYAGKQQVLATGDGSSRSPWGPQSAEWCAVLYARPDMTYVSVICMTTGFV